MLKWHGGRDGEPRAEQKQHGKEYSTPIASERMAGQQSQSDSSW
jgi:hypothetical protein